MADKRIAEFSDLVAITIVIYALVVYSTVTILRKLDTIEKGCTATTIERGK